MPGIRVSLQNPPPIRIAGQLTTAQYQYTLQDIDLAELYHWTDVMLDRMRQLPGFVDVNTNLNDNSPSIALDVDRDKLATAGPDLRPGGGRPAVAPSAAGRSPPSTAPATSTR